MIFKAGKNPPLLSSSCLSWSGHMYEKYDLCKSSNLLHICLLVTWVDPLSLGDQLHACYFVRTAWHQSGKLSSSCIPRSCYAELPRKYLGGCGGGCCWKGWVLSFLFWYFYRFVPLSCTLLFFKVQCKNKIPWYSWNWVRLWQSKSRLNDTGMPVQHKGFGQLCYCFEACLQIAKRT